MYFITAFSNIAGWEYKFLNNSFFTIKKQKTMAFCTGAMSAIRKIWNEITPELENVIEQITKVTGEIIALESDITVEAIVNYVCNYRGRRSGRRDYCLVR
jgi:hypothetical protein